MATDNQFDWVEFYNLNYSRVFTNMKKAC